jgi:hypothetical protein
VCVFLFFLLYDVIYSSKKKHFLLFCFLDSFIINRHRSMNANYLCACIYLIACNICPCIFSWLCELVTCFAGDADNTI